MQLNQIEAANALWSTCSYTLHIKAIIKEKQTVEKGKF